MGTVVVVGGGPAGVVAAAAHARRGFRVTILEANPKAANRFAGEWLHPTGAEVLDRLGIGRLPNADVQTGRGFVVFPDDGSAPVELPFPAGRVAMSFEHADFVEALRERVGALPGVTYIPHARVIGVAGGSVRYRDRDGEKQIQADRVIGADGRASKVRQFAGIDADSALISHMASVELRDVELPFEGFGHVLLGGPGPILMYRIAGNRVRACLDVPTAYSNQRNREFLWDAFSPVFQGPLREAFRRGLEEGPIPWAVSRFRPRAKYGAGQTHLVGDAVGHYHPLTAAGLTMGFLDAEACAASETLSEYGRGREADTYVPELLSNALYHVFSRDDASSSAIRSSVFEVWRGSAAERDRTLSILMGEVQGPAAFSATFSRMALSAFGSTVRDLGRAGRLAELPRTLASYRQWLQWPLASWAPRRGRARFRPNSTPFLALPMMPPVSEPPPAELGLGSTPPSGTSGTSGTSGSIAPAAIEAPEDTHALCVQAVAEALLVDLRGMVERMGHEPDWLLMRRATSMLTAIEAADLGTSMSARMRLGRRALAQQGVAALLAARTEPDSQVDARDVANFLTSVFEVRGGKLDSVLRVEEALDLQLAFQHASGGFGQRQGQRPDLMTTALCVRALTAITVRDVRLAPKASRGLELARGYLRSQQRDDGSWAAEGSHGPVSATALGLVSLVRAGVSARSAAAVRGASWLLARQREDGSFGDAEARVVERYDVVTARALSALCLAQALSPAALSRAADCIAERLDERVLPQLELRRGGEEGPVACELLDALSTHQRYKRDRPWFTDAPVSAGEGDDWEFCRQGLLAVSRTFSKPIAMLPGDLEVAVTCGYLLCRIADTIEDHPHVPRADKDGLFAQFLEVLEEDADPAPFLEGFMRIPGEDAELDLARNLPRVMRVFDSLPPAMTEAVSRWVCEMSRGMNLYVHREPGEDGYTALLTAGDLERYCYFVAGTVGHMLTDLIEIHAGHKLSEADRAELRNHAEGFGMGLQLVNILKDVTDDRERRWSFVPRALCQREGTSIERLVEPEERAKAHRAVAPLFDLAQSRLDDAIRYALTVPPDEVGVRLFCLLPLWMAAMTLKHARGNDAMFEVGQEVKISRKAVESVIAECVANVSDDAFLADRYAALWLTDAETKQA